MNDAPELPTKNTLFLAVTRPALWAGIPIEAAVLLLITSASVLIWSNSPLYTALVVAFGYPLTQDDIRTEDCPSFFADLLALDRDGQTSIIIEEGDEHG